MTQHPRGEMDEIPEDVWQLAVDALPGTARADIEATHTVIARAIMAERERCAMAAIEDTRAPAQRNSKDMWIEQIGQRIAAAIRKAPTP